MSRIIEHKYIEEIIPYITSLSNPEETLVLFDIDDVLINPKGNLGSYRWWKYKVDELQKNGLSIDKAFATLDNFFVTFGPHINYLLIEPKTISVFSFIQTSKAIIMGLTGRHTSSINMTKNHLGQFGIHFTEPLAIKEQIINATTASFSYVDGIIYCNSLCKGDAITEILTRASFKPKKIIFIDDVLENLVAVQKAVTKIDADIAFIGIHYTHIASFISFNPSVAEQELQNIQQTSKGQISL